MARFLGLRTDVIRNEQGGITVLSLFFLITFIMLGGLAIDVTNVMTARTQLQVAADAAAHAALLAREDMSEDEAISAGVAMAMLNMPADRFGDVLTVDEVSFGVWDADAQTFTPQPGAKNAVLVLPKRTETAGNPVATYLLHLVGLDAWNLHVQAIFTTYHPTCFREGFVARDVVDLQSNNSYSNGFCIHSNEHVSLNSNNYFEPGTVVSMPDENDIDLPNSGFKTNEGLEQALRSGSYHIRVLDQIDDIIAGLESLNTEVLPTYITGLAPANIVTLNSKKAINATMLVPGRLHTMTCSGGGAANIEANTLVSSIALVTNCAIKFGQGVILQDTVIATTNTGAKSLTAASGLQVGRNDSCATGGGAQLVTMGGMDFPADLKVYGGQLLAANDINFSANANGIEGASFVAGGTISGTSNMAMGFCGTGMEQNFHAEYFRLVY
ncbi:MAG: pilus assembly protein TadG-related protein [Pseudomonadota bacterium]